VFNDAGAVFYHEWGTAAGSHFKGGSWAVEYARGFIPSTMYHAVADTLFCTLDFVAMFKMSYLFLKAMLFEAGYYMTHMQELIA